MKVVLGLAVLAITIGSTAYVINGGFTKPVENAHI